MAFRLFSIEVETSLGDQPSAVGAAIEVGDERQIKRPPIGVARAVAKVAGGAASTLTADEIDKITKFDVQLKQMRDGRYTAAGPVTVVTYFIPAKKY